jgi:hypothetical protein
VTGIDDDETAEFVENMMRRVISGEIPLKIRPVVEVVARAICEAEKMNPDDALGGWVHWTEAATAAIDAYHDYIRRNSCPVLSRNRNSK